MKLSGPHLGSLKKNNTRVRQGRRKDSEAESSTGIPLVENDTVANFTSDRRLTGGDKDFDAKTDSSGKAPEQNPGGSSSPV